MTQQTDPRDHRGAPGTGAGPAPMRTGPERSDATGWVRFGAVVMVVVGVFGVIEGLIAALTPSYFVTVGGAVFVLSLAGWGWVHLALGALVAIVGATLLGEAPSWARGRARNAPRTSTKYAPATIHSADEASTLVTSAPRSASTPGSPASSSTMMSSSTSTAFSAT